MNNSYIKIIAWPLQIGHELYFLSFFPKVI